MGLRRTHTHTRARARSVVVAVVAAVVVVVVVVAAKNCGDITRTTNAGNLTSKSKRSVDAHTQAKPMRGAEQTVSSFPETGFDPTLSACIYRREFQARVVGCPQHLGDPSLSVLVLVRCGTRVRRTRSASKKASTDRSTSKDALGVVWCALTNASTSTHT